MGVETVSGGAFVCPCAPEEQRRTSTCIRGALWSPPMKESTKRIIDWLTLLFLGGALAAAVRLHFTQTKQSFVIWLVLLILDLPFAAAALIWLGHRGLNTFPPMTERTKRVIDWLTLVPLGLWSATMTLVYYAPNEQAPVTFSILMLFNIPLTAVSIIWLGLRRNKIPAARWVTYKAAMHPYLGLLFGFAAPLLLLIAIPTLLLVLVKWLWG